jgi:hypothetical protein
MQVAGEAPGQSYFTRIISLCLDPHMSLQWAVGAQRKRRQPPLETTVILQALGACLLHMGVGAVEDTVQLRHAQHQAMVTWVGLEVGLDTAKELQRILGGLHQVSM